MKTTWVFEKLSWVLLPDEKGEVAPHPRWRTLLRCYDKSALDKVCEAYGRRHPEARTRMGVSSS